MGKRRRPSSYGHCQLRTRPLVGGSLHWTAPTTLPLRPAAMAPCADVSVALRSVLVSAGSLPLGECQRTLVQPQSICCPLLRPKSVGCADTAAVVSVHRHKVPTSAATSFAATFLASSEDCNPADGANGSVHTTLVGSHTPRSCDLLSTGTCSAHVPFLVLIRPANLGSRSGVCCETNKIQLLRSSLSRTRATYR